MIRRLSVLLLLFALAACDRPTSEYKDTLYVFGTLVEITIRGSDEQTARKAVAALSHDFQRMHRDWHAWKPGELGELNRAIAEGRPFAASPFLLPLVIRARELSELADGLFNPAIGGLIALWGFHSDELPKGSLPDFAAVADLVRRAPSMADLTIEGTVVRSANPAVRLDFGGFAKGTALDMAVERLKSFGIAHAIVNAGGDLNTLGSAGERPWKVGIRHPVGWGVIASIELGDDENLYTSGNYERFREDQGVRRGHIIDPRDGMPVKHIVSASVIHPLGDLADAAATALTVAGPDDWQRIARRMGIRHALLVDDQGTVHASRAMAARLRFEPGEPKRLIVVDLD